MSTIALTFQKNQKLITLQEALFGGTLLVMGSMVEIPTLPISTTLQTLALYVLALSKGPRFAFLGAMCFLAMATMGFPVLCGGSNPLWMIGKTGGYLVAFPIAAYLIGVISQGPSSTLTKMVALLIGQALILGFGFLWLAQFIGYQTAWLGGVLYFIPLELIKGMAAIALVRVYKLVAGL